MENFIEAIYGLLIPQVVAGLIGGLIGAMISIKVELYGWRISILMALGAIISAGALAEYLTYAYDQHFILLHGVLGILVGIVGNAALDAINLAAPTLMKRAVDRTGDGLLVKIDKYLPTKNKDRDNEID